MQRNSFIDIVKGITILNVILIHTIFYSGELYLPSFLQTFVILIDVPIFFLVSGLTSSGSIERTVKRLVKLQFTYCLYIAILFMVCYLSHDYFSIRKIMNFVFHQYYGGIPNYELAGGSLWYLRVYFIVVFCGAICIRFLTSKQRWILMAILFLGISSLELNIDGGNDLPYLNFYLFIFLLGYQFKEVQVSRTQFSVGLSLLIAGVIGVVVYQGVDNFHLQSYKFPPRLIYLLASSFSLLLVLYLKGCFNSKENILSRIGRDSLFVYFAQGLSSTAIFVVVEFGLKINTPTYLLLVVSFVLNVALALLLAFILKKLDGYMWQGVYWIKRITS